MAGQADTLRNGFRAPSFGLSDSIDSLCLERLAALSSELRPVARGTALFRQGDRLNALYEVHAGFFKTAVTDVQGRSQVTGFHLSGDLLGLDGIGSDHHGADAVALEDAMVSVIPYGPLNELFREFAPLQHGFHKVMSREITRDQNMMLVLGTLSAEGRIAAFLLDLTQRLHARGFSATALLLRMTREEIGSYLGLQLETVSRTFSKLQHEGVLEIRNRDLQVRDPEALQRLVQGGGR
ncbi:MAG: helix-turn-helix domain-containing protein [Betaproteobacteria bacterium]|nr:helix-turn-helix domain-containing protein [Betaproteobacteria bacterium]